MSSGTATSPDSRPPLKSKTSSGWGWGWPRLVDKPVAATLRRSSSTRSHTGAFHSFERSPTGPGQRNRASSLTDEFTPAAPLSEEVPAAKPASEDTRKKVAIAEAVEEAPEATGEELEVPGTVVQFPCSAPKRITEEEDTCHDPEHQPGPSTSEETEPCHDPEHHSVEPKPLRESTANGKQTATGPGHQSDPDTTSSLSSSSMGVLQAIGLLPSSPRKQAEEPSKQSAEKSAEIAPETSVQPDPSTLPPLPASPVPEPAYESYFNKPVPISPLPHPMSSEASTASTESKETIDSEETPRPFPLFRELPVEPAEPAEPAEPITNTVSAPPLEDHQQRPVSTSEVPAPVDVNRLPPPRILVIRASSDDQADMLRSPFTPDIPGDIGNPLENVNTTAPNSPVPSGVHPGASLSPSNLPTARVPPNTPVQDATVPSGPGVPDMSLPTSDLIREDLGAVNVAGPPCPRKQRKGKKLIRKTRRVMLRSPVLNLILGRQLAHLTQPALKIIADGGELPAMAVVGKAVDTVGAVTGPVGAVGAMGAMGEAMA